MATAYRDAGVRAWTVWVDGTDRASADLLRSAGHVLDGRPAAMTLDLAELPAGAPEIAESRDLVAAGDVHDQAWGDAPGTWARALARLPPGDVHLYLARHAGRPAAFVLVHDHAGDCAFLFAATVPETRRRGLVSGLLHRALIDARDRGCTSSTTQASAVGRPVYERLGYRTIATLELWERRATQRRKP